MHRVSIRSHAAGVLCATTLLLCGQPALAQQKIRVGLMLPYTGTYAALGTAITNGFKLALNEAGGKFGGREIEYITVDDESEPAKAPDNVNKLIKRDNVDVVVGDGRVYTTRSEADGALKTVKVCESGGTVGGPVAPAVPR